MPTINPPQRVREPVYLYVISGKSLSEAYQGWGRRRYYSLTFPTCQGQLITAASRLLEEESSESDMWILAIESSRSTLRDPRDMAWELTAFAAAFRSCHSSPVTGTPGVSFPLRADAQGLSFFFILMFHKIFATFVYFIKLLFFTCVYSWKEDLGQLSCC